MKKNFSIFTKIAVIVSTLAILAGAAFAAYTLFKKAPGIGELANLFAPGPLQGPESSTRAEDLDADEIIYWTNYYREQDGKNDLTQNNKLTAAAQAKARDMFAKGYFEHTSPTGETAADLVIAQGYNYKIVGENLALGDFESEKDLVDAWMASEGHRENILRKEFTEIGVASKLAKFNGRLTWISVQEFGTPAPNCTIPDQNLKNQIDSLKTQLDSLANQINILYDEGNSLINQGNDKIAQGNQIYQQTHDKSAAQPYWDEGKALQDAGQSKINQAKSLEPQYNQLKSEMENLISEYNSQVNDYNACIK